MKLLLRRPSKIWFSILSELCINLTAGLFIILLAEPLMLPVENIGIDDLLLLTHNIASGILLLLLAKKLREDSKK
jgi:hypothetical protein